MAVMDGSPKDETPVRTSKNHYTPVHKASNHGRKLISNRQLQIFSVSSTEKKMRRNHGEQSGCGRGHNLATPAGGSVRDFEALLRVHVPEIL